MRAFTKDDAEVILRSSEGRASPFRATGSGHTAARHFLISNADLQDRYWRELSRDNSPSFLIITAFCGTVRGEMADAAQLVLNSKQAQAAINTFFMGGNDGMRAEIRYAGDRTFPMRYVASSGYAVQTMPADNFVMVLDRSDKSPFRLHIQTFFGAIPLQPRNCATIKDPQGRLLFTHLG